MKKKLRVLHAPTEIAGQAYLLTRGLRDLGHKAIALDYREEKVFERKLDINISIYKYPKALSWPIKIIILIWSLLNFDIFHFHFGRTLIGNSELLFKILKKFNKKIVIHFHGSDIRDTEFIIHKAEKGVVWEGETPTTEEKRKLITLSKKYADKIIVSTPDLLELVGNEKSFWLPVSYDPELDKINSEAEFSKKIKVLHAPSNRLVKGTEFVVKSLSNNSDIELNLISKKSRKDVVRQILKSDIVIDQVIVGWYGLLAVEAMILQKPVVCFLKKDLQKTYGSGLPIINTSPKDLFTVISSLSKNKLELRELGAKGKKFALKEHNLKNNSKKLESIYRSL